MEKPNLMDLTGRKAIITGGNRGLGRKTAEYFLLHGAEVCLIDVSDHVSVSAKELAEQTGGKAHAVCADLSDHANRKPAFDQALALLGGSLDILINCAGIQYACEAEVFPYEQYRKIMDVNIDAMFELCQLAAGVMIPAGKGSIVNFASISGILGSWHASAYTASKGAVASLTKALSNEWAGHGIRVNAVAPGYINTVMNAAFFASDDSSRVFRRIALKRWGRDDEVASAVLFLASDAASYITGTTLPVEGGAICTE